MDEMEQQGVLQVATADANSGGSDEVVQVIMQEDGQIVMPEGQFIQVNTDDGQPQFIQVIQSVIIKFCTKRKKTRNESLIHVNCNTLYMYLQGSKIRSERW